MGLPYQPPERAPPRAVAFAKSDDVTRALGDFKAKESEFRLDPWLSPGRVVP